MPEVISAAPSALSSVTSEAPPTHYTIKIESFSLLAKNNVEKYESGAFEAGGYRWKLIIYPNGNKSKNVKDEASAYLAIAEPSSLPLGWEVYATFRLFLLDQNRDSYLIRQDDAAGKGRRFHAYKVEWGFDHFIPLATLNDGSKGYLLEDACVFGAEVFVCKERCSGKGERVLMLKQPTSFKHTWKLDSFTKLGAASKDSEIFNLAGHNWKIILHPQGKGVGAGTHLSMFLVLVDTTTLVPPLSRVCLDFTLRILDQVKGRKSDLAAEAKSWFSATNRESGWDRYISLDYFYRQNNALLVKDISIVEAEVSLIGLADVYQ